MLETLPPVVVEVPVPPKARLKAPLMVPELFRVSPEAPLDTNASLPNVNRPVNVAAAPLFNKAPAEPMPVPLMVKATVFARVNPFRSNAPPLATTAEAAEPNGELLTSPTLPNLRVPALINVPPLNVLVPATVQVPASTFVSDPAPVPKTLVSVPPTAPPKVRLNPLPEMVPVLLMLMAPVPPTILLLLPKLI